MILKVIFAIALIGVINVDSVATKGLSQKWIGTEISARGK